MAGRVIIMLLCAWGLIGCGGDEAPILRGTRLPTVNYDQSPEAKQPAVQAEEATSATPIILNLTLPDYEWDDMEPMEQASLIPDVFSGGTATSRLNWSGRIHIDESEEASARPISDTILGAEVEVQVSLP